MQSANLNIVKYRVSQKQAQIFLAAFVKESCAYFRLTRYDPAVGESSRGRDPGGFTDRDHRHPRARSHAHGQATGKRAHQIKINLEKQYTEY